MAPNFRGRVTFAGYFSSRVSAVAMNPIAFHPKTRKGRTMTAPQANPFVADGEPYSREEMRNVGDSLPTRGPICPKCKKHIPQFRDLTPQDESRLRQLILENRKIVATQELRSFTGCPISWAKLWVLHSGRADSIGTTAPCPYCGKPLITARAKQCQHCLMDWHDPASPKRLG